MSKINIISLGLSQSNFLTQLYKEIILRSDKFAFHVNHFFDLSKGNVDYDSTIFRSYHDFEASSFSKWQYLQSFFALLFCKTFWSFFWFEVKRGAGTKALKNFLFAEVKAKTVITKKILPLRFDIYHFHFCKKNTLRLIHYLPKKSKIVCSFWGSDLYRNDNEVNHFYVKKALEKATAVTIQTPEMGKDLFERYGNFLKLKTYYAQFAIETSIYQMIDKYRNDKTSLYSFKKQYNIPKDHRVITIGYNANKAFNHIRVLKELNELETGIKAKLTCLLPLTYSRNSANYLHSLYRFIDTLNMNVICLNEFMAHSDIAKLRLITDVQIQMPISDALSGSVTEVLYSGNIVLAGSWLPYGIYDRIAVPVIKIKDFNELQDRLKRTFENLDNLKLKNKNALCAIPKNFFPDVTTGAWIKVYEKVLSKQKNN